MSAPRAFVRDASVSAPVAAMKDERGRDPARITYLVTASGVKLGGVGSAFRGVAAGAIATAAPVPSHHAET